MLNQNRPFRYNSTAQVKLPSLTTHSLQLITNTSQSISYLNAINKFKALDGAIHSKVNLISIINRKSKKNVKINEYNIDS